MKKQEILDSLIEIRDIWEEIEDPLFDAWNNGYHNDDELIPEQCDDMRTKLGELIRSLQEWKEESIQ